MEPHAVERSARDISADIGWSSGVVFVDLTKAFDWICWELVVGWGPEFVDDDQKISYLMELGASESVAREVVRTINEEGTALQQMGVGPAIQDLVRSLHEGAWFQCDGSGKLLITRRGGRQGCGRAWPAAALRRTLLRRFRAGPGRT